MTTHPPPRPWSCRPAAALFAGTPTATPENLIPLSVDPTGLHRNRVWEAWDTTTGRTSRWGALVALGATIRAADLAGLQPYARPRPMEVRQVRHGIGIRQVPHDPEDADVAVAAAPG